jgi:hypothetical protein
MTLPAIRSLTRDTSRLGFKDLVRLIARFNWRRRVTNDDAERCAALQQLTV